MTAHVESFFDPATATVSHVLYDRSGGSCAVIDPVLDYDARSGRTATASADRIIAFAKAQQLQCVWLLETHAHADHLSAAQYLREHVGGRTAIGRHICTVQRTFRDIYNLGPALPVDGSQFDRLLDDGDELPVGSLTVRVMHLPGHTPADVAYLCEDVAFIGDTLFMPDVGSARCDFPGGDAGTLYRSARRLLELPPDTTLYLCHDYPPEGRGPQWSTTVAEQRAGNKHLMDGVSEDAFITMRQTRDATLAMPNLLLPSLQVNIRAGALPDPEDNGVSYLKLPLNAL